MEESDKGVEELGGGHGLVAPVKDWLVFARGVVAAGGAAAFGEGEVVVVGFNGGGEGTGELFIGLLGCRSCSWSG